MRQRLAQIGNRSTAALLVFHDCAALCAALIRSKGVVFEKMRLYSEGDMEKGLAGSSVRVARKARGELLDAVELRRYGNAIQTERFSLYR